MSNYSYQEAVEILRADPNNAELVIQCYLDKDNSIAAERFCKSDEFKAVIKYLKIPKTKQTLKILDIGCGNGIASYAFASLGHDVFALDPDPSDDVGLGATKRLQKDLKSGSISVYKGFAETLPFDDNFFDVAYCRQALHHFTDLRRGVSEAFRVLKPNGIFLATREHVVDNETQLNIFLQNHVLHMLHGGENAYKLSNYLYALKQVGFKVLKCLAPYDNVINYFPNTKKTLKGNLEDALQRRFGYFPSLIISNLPYIVIVYQKYLSITSKAPGRAYSFLCIKEKI